MLRLVCAILLIFVNGVLMCKWVCIDSKNNIKKTYFDQSKFQVEFHNHEISIPAVKKPAERKGRKLNEGPVPPFPEVTLKMPTEYEVLPLQVSCNSRDFVKRVKEMTKKIKCKPRDTIVDIKYKGARQITPPRISTKLCSGVCSGSKICVPLASRNITIAVSILDASNQAQCSHVLVPEDTKCKCGCDKKASDCMAFQELDKKFCKCKCKNEKDHNDCLMKIRTSYDKYEWNKNTCSCQCKRESVCSTGTFWSKTDCKCVRKLK